MNRLGQVFTRAETACRMAALFDLPSSAALLDPCCGKGAFIAALKERGFSRISALELDEDLHARAAASFPDCKIFNADFLSWQAGEKYDGVIMNPPYIRQEKIDDLAAFGITKAKLRSREMFRELPATANLYMYFTIRAIELLKAGGQLLVIFPSSWMNARSGCAFRKLMLARCLVEKEIHVDCGAFEGCPLVKTAIMKLVRKNGKAAMLQAAHANSCRTGLQAHQSESLPLALADLAAMKRGLTTFCNEMFINPPIADESCLKEILSSPRQLDGYSVEAATLDRIFIPSGEPRGEVRAYLDSWKERIMASGKPKTLCRKILSGCGNWHSLPAANHQGILFGYTVRARMKFTLNERGILALDNFLILKPAIDQWLLFALLNNYHIFWQLEKSGKQYGGGILKLQAYDLARLRFPRVTSLSEQERLRALGWELAASGDSGCIDAITRLLASHYQADSDEVRAGYFSKRAERLGE